MRVAYLVSQYPAPSHTFIRREIAALRKKGAEIHIFSVRSPSPEEVMSDLDRSDLDETGYLLPVTLGKVFANQLRMLVRRPGRYLSALRSSLRHRNPGARALLYSAFYFAEGMLLAERLQEKEVEHLHNHFANSASNAALVASRYLDISLSLTLHGLCDFDFPAGPLLAEKVAASTFIACATQYGLAQAMRLCSPSDWYKLTVVRCGVELDKLGAPRVRDPGSTAPLRIICVGRLSPEKGQLGLIESFAAATRRGLDAELVLVGDGPDRDRVEACVQTTGMQSRVHFLGRLPEARTLEEISKSDVLVVASFMEGLPVVLMEALAMQVPVIAPTIAGIPELVEDGAVGRTFFAGDWHQLADRMLELGSDPAMRARFGAEGRKRIEAAFDVERAVRPLLERFTAAAEAPVRSGAPQAVASGGTR